MSYHQSIHDYGAIRQRIVSPQQLQIHPLSTTTLSPVDSNIDTYNKIQSLLFYIFTVVFIVFKKLLKLSLHIFYKMITEAVVLIAFTLWKEVKTFIWSLWPQPHHRQQRKFRKIIVSPFRNALVNYLEDVAEDLAPSDRYLREGKRVAQLIFDKLKMELPNHGLKIGKTKIAGSFGKRTGISFKKANDKIQNPDLDLVVFVNDEDPPFSHVYEVFKVILKQMDEIRDHTVHVKKYSVQFTIITPTQGDIKVDLLASTNRTKHPSEWAGFDMSDVQTALELNALKQKQANAIRRRRSIDQDLNKLYSSTFAEKTLDIINEYVKDPFILKMIRLAKLWNARLDLNGSRPARSCMIEVIAIYTQRRRRGRNGERCVVCGFRRFLEAIAKLESLDISLDEINNNRELSEVGLPVNFTKPMVRDPVNYFNNLAYGMDRSVLALLVSQAEKTLSLLEKCKRDSGASYRSVENAIDEIFFHKN